MTGLSSTEETQEMEQYISESVSSSGIMSSSQSLMLNALMAWLLKFPQMMGFGDDSHDKITLLNHEDVATAILYITDEICEQSTAWASSKKGIDNVWKTVALLLQSKKVWVLSQDRNMGTPEMHVLLLSALFCYAVSDDCREQRDHVKRVLELPPDDQRALMTLVKKGHILDSEPQTRTTPRMSGSKRNATFFDSADAPYEEVFELVGFSTESTVDTFFFPDLKNVSETIPSLSCFDEEIVGLREENEILKQELRSSQQREHNLMQRLGKKEDKFHKEMMKLESISRQREEEIHDNYRQEIARLQTETRYAHEEFERQMMATHSDQTDALQHAEGKLAETENKLKLCKERLEEFAEVKKKLINEEQAHIASVEECHRLEKELKSMQPLKQQLENYRERAACAEHNLLEREEELKVLYQITEDLERRQEEVLAEKRSHMEDAEELRRQLLAKEEKERLNGASDLNETESIEVAQLRQENMQLRVFLAEVEQHSQFELSFSQEHVADLQARVDVMTSKVEIQRSELEDKNNELIEIQGSLVTAWRQLQEAEMRLEEVESWKRKANDAQFFSAQRQDLLKTIQEETENSLEEAEETELSLLNDVAEWMKIATETESALEKCRKESLKMKQALFITKASLEKALRREEVLERKIEDLKKSEDSLTEKLEQERGSKEEALATANKILQEALFDDQKVISTSNQITDLSETIVTLTDTIKELRREQCKLQEDNGRFRILLVTNSDVQDQLATLDDNKALKDLDSSTSGSAGPTSPEDESALGNLEGKKNETVSSMQTDSVSSQVEALIQMNAELVATVEEFKRDQCKEEIKETIDSYKQKALVASSEVIDLRKTNGDLIDSIEGLKCELQKANDQFQRQLDERFEAFNKVHDQLETLQTEFSALLNENEGLKKNASTVSRLQKCVVSAIYGSTEVFSSRGTSSGHGFYGSTPERLRSEYELKVESLMKEKRKLIIRSNDAITSMHKAERQTWEYSQQVTKLKKELETAKIAQSTFQRALKGSLTQDSDGTNDNGDTNGTKENHTLSVEASGLEIIRLGAKVIVDPELEIIRFGAKVIVDPSMQCMSAPLSSSSMNVQVR